MDPVPDTHLTDTLMRRAEFRDLPVVGHLNVLTEALATRRVVVQAPPGTGKTTAVPPMVAAMVPGRVVVTQPRRIAARSAARRLAHLTQTRPGEYAGHTVRGESTATRGTKIEFVTTGVLLRRLLRDPELPGVDAIILDEVHERHLDDDLALAIVTELLELRDDLTVVAMSATLDAQRWSDLVGGAAIVEVPSTLHPLEIRWAPFNGPATGPRGTNRAFLDHIAHTTRDAVGEHPGESALVFVPGARDVDHVVGALADLDREVLPLHGRLSSRDQDRALHPGGPRVVVATSVAESSLTVPGVRIVVDSMLSREPRFDQARGVAGLVTVRTSQASATQRAGRAARLGPGVAIRCLTADDWAGLDPDITPEILHADLTGPVLTLACWGTPRGQGMNLPTPLPRAGLERAEDELFGLGLIDEDARATDLGRRVATIPAEPRLACALITSAGRIGSRRAAEIVALLAADEVSGDDLGEALREVRRGNSAVGRRWREEASRLERLVSQTPAPHGLADERALARVVATARPGWISRVREDGSYVSASGTGLTVSRGSRLAGEWLAVWDTQRIAGADSLIRAAVPIDQETALEAGSHLVTEDVETRWDGGRARGRATRRLGAIILSHTATKPTRNQSQDAIRAAIADQGIDAVFTWSEGAEGLRRRLAVAHRSLGGAWPDVSDGALVERLDEWLAPEILAVADGRPARRADVGAALRRLVPWPEAGRIEELVPERLTVPSGSAIRLEYPPVGSDAAVVLAVKLQECFGLTTTPAVVEGREPVVMHLLSPARRPLAVTDDLASFWVNVYPQVRAENRGRYAKHPWPEDPLSAPAMRRTTRSGR